MAIEAYTAFEPIVAASPNPKVRDMAWQFAGAKRRLKLPSHPMEIIGVSCDGAKDVVEEFVAKEQIPWLTLYDEGDGTWPPLAKHYGLPGIPVMILVGRDGNVVSVRARGAELSRELEKLFGDQAKTEAPAPQP